MFHINGETWYIMLVAPNDISLLMPNGRFAIGACNDSTKTIYINAELYGEEFEQVLCHEIVHASMFAYDILLERDDEEMLAEIVSTFGEEIIDLTDIMFDKIRRGGRY